MPTSADPDSDRPDPDGSHHARAEAGPDSGKHAGASDPGRTPASESGQRSPIPGRPSPIKVERVLAELNRLRSDLEKDPRDPEWFAIHHAFCFVSYKMGDFQRYLDETVKPGEHPGA